MTQEKEWWNHVTYLEELEPGKPLSWNMPKIVAEATRRAEKKAWEQAYQQIKDMASIIPAKTNIRPKAALEIAMFAIASRINALKAV